MSFNILDAAKGLFTNELVSNIAGNFGENENTINKAISGVVPGILGSLIGKSETPGGAASVLNLIQSAASQFGDKNPNQLMENPSLLSSGWDLVKGLLGGQSDNFLSKLVSFSGSKVSTITSLLGLAGPMIFKMLGKHVGDNGLTSSGLSSLLSGNKSAVMSALPGGLDLGNVFSNAFSSVSHSTDHAAHKVSEAAKTYTSYEEPKSGGGNKWLLPLLLLLALGALLWWFLSKDRKAEETTVVTTDSTVVTTPEVTYVDPTTLGTYDSVTGNFNYNIGNDIELKLADGKTLKVGENSAEAKIYKFLTDAGMVVDTIDKSKGWIALDRVYFETGKNILTKESVQQLQNIAAIMKAYPNSNIKFGGYTDNTGDAAANLTLSGNRAQAAMDAVKNMGIDAARMASEGYGSEHPIADNATAEGRALNRRVDVRVTAK